jgi:hypothetical protein
MAIKVNHSLLPIAQPQEASSDFSHGVLSKPRLWPASGPFLWRKYLMEHFQVAYRPTGLTRVYICSSMTSLWCARKSLEDFHRILTSSKMNLRSRSYPLLMLGRR